ncbi:MAG: NAD-binding protein [Planctomycetota bacterium]
MINRDRWILFEVAFVTLCVCVVGVLGFYGFEDYYNLRNGRHYSSLTLFYETLQLFTFQFEMVEPPKSPDGAALGWKLEIARLAAPFLSSYAVVRAMMALFAERLHSARVSFLNGHVVICGLSRKGFALVKDFRSRGVPVVLVEWDKENDRLENCRDLGAHLIMGDATEEVTLRKAGVDRARLLFAVCDEDGVNAEVAILAQSMVTRAVGKPPLDMYLHIDNLKLFGLLRAHGIGELKSAGTRFRIFNIHENAARHALKTHPLDGAGIRPDDPRAVHLVLIGFGKMGEMLALHAAQMGHYANGKKLRITVIDRLAKAHSSHFLGRHTAFDSVCDVDFVSDDFESQHVLESIERFARDRNQLLNVIVCLPEDSLSLTSALRCAEVFKEHGVPILVRLERDSGLAVLAEHPRVTTGARIRTFVVGGSFCSEKEVVEKDRARLARAIHEDRRAHADATHPVPHWHDLDEESQGFYRQAADHVPVKLRALGCEMITAKTAPVAFTFSAGDIELLARMEHRRWMASRLLAGFRYGQTQDGRKDANRRVHPHLVTWDELPESEREVLRQTAARIPDWLCSIGKCVRHRSVAVT